MRGRDGGDGLQQFGEQAGIEDLVTLRQHAGHVWVVFLDAAHCIVDLVTEVRSFGQVQQVIKPGGCGQVKNALRMVGRRFIYSRTTAGGGTGLFQLCILGVEADFSKAQEDETEHWLGVFGLFQSRTSPELVGGIPQAFFQRGGVYVFFGWRYPLHVVKLPRDTLYVDYYGLHIRLLVLY